MSVPVQPFDLSVAVVGTPVTLDWSNCGMPTAITARPPRIQLFNESGCSLRVKMRGTGRGFNLPAGGWIPGGVLLKTGETGLDAVVTGIIPNGLINQLQGTYWHGEEEAPQITLGNSPIGISGAVTTSNIQSLVNDGQAPGTSIVESTPSDQASSSNQDYNDGSGFRKLLSANVLRTAWNFVRGNATSGKAALQFGDSGDATISTFYGSLQGGQPANVGALTSGAITGTGANSLDSAAITTNGAGALTTSGTVSSTAATGFQFGNSGHYSQLNGDQGGSIELGSHNSVDPGAAQSPYIDFHSSHNAVDYDVRVQASGGNSSTGQGTLALIAAGGVQVTSGPVSEVNGVNTAGNYGVPLVAAVNRITGNNGSLTNVVSITVPNDGVAHIVRAAGGLLVGAGNTNTGVVTLSLNYTDAYDGGVNLAFNVYSQTNLISGISQAKGASIRVDERISLVSPNTTVTIQYKNTAAGSISDSVWGILELLA